MATMAPPMPDTMNAPPLGGVPDESKFQIVPHGQKDSIDPTSDAPDTQAGPENAPLEKDLQEELIKLRKQLKEANSQKRLTLIRRITRAFETLKNNPYTIFNGTDAQFDTLNELLKSTRTGDEAELYQYNDNVYQMLGLTFISTLSADVPKTRYQPADADKEQDILTAQKASTIQAYVERRNGIKALQKLSLLYLWCTGSYFRYTRHIIDKNRAGIKKDPIVEFLPQEIVPSRYICSACSQVTEESDLGPDGLKCPSCGRPFSDRDWYEPVTAVVPQQAGYKESAAGMTAMDVLSGLSVDADPDAQELYESLYLDYEGETNIAWVRAQYPEMYEQIQPGGSSGGSSTGDTAANARQMVTTPGGSGKGFTNSGSGTYSRCWIQAEAFNAIEDKSIADRLTQKFPNGVKLVSFSNDLFLQAVPERMTDKWTWCGAIKGLGLYPFGVGDVALDVQTRINDCANNIHAYMDRLCFGTLLVDGDSIDVDAFTSKSLTPGNVTEVTRIGEAEGMLKPLQEMIYQPQFHADPGIFTYHPQLVQLAQVLAGVQPQVFGGSDPNVQTKGGQEQALQTALGRMKLFWDQIREEAARGAQNAVRCTIENMDDVLKIVTSGDMEGDYKNEVIMQSELTGDCHAYPESDEGFPASYEEIQKRVLQLVEMASKGSFLMEVMSDPDTQKVVSQYILPPGVRLPGDSSRARIKTLCELLAKDKPRIAQGPDGQPILGPDGQPIVVPSITLDPRYDDMGQAQAIAKKWCNDNWRMQETQPDGFANVLAMLTMATQLVEQVNAQQALQQQAAAQGHGGPPALPPPPPQ